MKIGVTGQSKGRIQLLPDVVRNESGAFAIVFSLCAAVLLGFVALGIDTYRWHRTRSDMTAVADSAALAAASKLTLSQALDLGDEVTPLAVSTAESFIAAQLGNGFASNINVDPASGIVTVSIKARGTTTFAQTIGFQGADIGVTSQAQATISKTVTACIIALEPSAPVGIDFSLGGTIIANDCAIWSNATSETSSIDANGSGLVEASRTCAVGGIAKGSLDIQPAAQTHCPPVVDPLAAWSPPISVPVCDKAPVLKFDEGAQTLSPGVYCGGIKVGGSTQLTLEPGIYYIVDDGLKVNGGANVVGHGVTIVSMGNNASIDFLGNSGVELSAPTTGPTAGLVLAGGRDQPQVASMIGGGASSRLLGTVYLPSHDLGFGGNTEVSMPTDFTVLIARTLKFHGGATFEIRSDHANSPVPAIAPEVTVESAARLIR